MANRRGRGTYDWEDPGSSRRGVERVAKPRPRPKILSIPAHGDGDGRRPASIIRRRRSSSRSAADVAGSFTTSANSIASFRRSWRSARKARWPSATASSPRSRDGSCRLAGVLPRRTVLSRPDPLNPHRAAAHRREHRRRHPRRLGESAAAAAAAHRPLSDRHPARRRAGGDLREQDRSAG